MVTFSTQNNRCASAGRVTARLLLAFLVCSPCAVAVGSVDAGTADGFDITGLEPIPIPPSEGLPFGGRRDEINFELKHVFHHGTYKYPGLHRRLDVHPEVPLHVTDDESLNKIPAPMYKARSRALNIQRLADRRRETIDSILEVGRMTGKAVDLPLSAWTTDEVPAPNITDKETVLSFARMASNAYILEPHTGDWEDVGGGFNYTEDFGWEADGLRGHIFADTENRTVVMGLKGTSPAVFDGSETTTNDKINDNLFFSCCCGQGGQFLWRQVCECQTSTYQCNSTCLVQALKAKNRYYYAAQDLYHNVTALYPNADIWVTGHSLGGAVSSMLGLTFGLPVVTFEAVPEAMPAARLGLPTPPGYQVGTMQAREDTGGYHFGHTADPVYMGTCNSASSSCTFGGYAMQSVCHTGHKCVYDTVHDFGWRVGIGTHKIVSVIKDVIEKYDQPPKCERYINCTDCYPWEFYESNGTESTTTTGPTSTSTWTRTRTSTCKTPGWWGCLDESTTETTTTTTTTSTSTSTCKTPGWFGCKDSTTTTESSTSHTAPAKPAPTLTSHSSYPTATTSCAHPGWFGGCNDPTPKPTSALTSSTSRHHTSCTSRKFFGLICKDGKATTTDEPVTPTPPPDPWRKEM